MPGRGDAVFGLSWRWQFRSTGFFDAGVAAIVRLREARADGRRAVVPHLLTNSPAPLPLRNQGKYLL
jgi:hypothetical protein